MGFTKVATTTASSSVASADKVSSANLNPTRYRNKQCRSMGTTYTQVSGGTTTDYLVNGVAFRTHTITASGNLTVSTGKFMEFLIAGGGGAGGAGGGSSFQEWGGGGGGGGLFYNQILPFGPGVYPITIGAGAPNPSGRANGANGSSTTAFGLTALGGGGGSGEQATRTGANGASGGGGAGRQDQGAGASGGSGTQSTTFPGVFGGLTIQVGLGNNGGGTGGDNTNIVGGGGGGGAGGGGGSGSYGTSAGAGGAGVASSITGTSYTYCGGGAGANSGSAATLYGQGGGGLHGGTASSGFQGIVIVKYQL
jgi:hypothetical protein